MAKRKVGSQTASLTPDQKKSRIDPIYLAEDNVPHTVGKLLTRATTLLNIAPRFEVCSQSYGAPKSRESQLERFWDSHVGVPGEKSHLDVGPMERYRGEPLAGREATSPSIIRKIEKIQGGEQAPRNGSLTLPKDAAVKPFSLKGKLNAILIVLSLILARRSNGLLGGHAHLRRNFPRLEQNPLEGVLAIEVPSASFGPEIIE